MRLEDRVRSTLKEAAVRITPSESGVAQTRLAEPPAKRRVRPVAAFLAGAIGVMVLGAVVVLIRPYGFDATDPAATLDVETVKIADLIVPVVDSEPTLDDPTVWLGLPGPSPQFDTSEFGPDLSFTPGEPAPDDLDHRVVEAVYVGDLDDLPFYIFSRNAPSIFDRLGEVISGNFSGQIIGTPLDCCTGGRMDHEGGFPGVSGSQTNDEPSVIAAQWIGLSPDVSVVAYQFDGVFVGWQTPVGGVSAIQPTEAPGEYLIIAFDAQGRELHRYGPHDGPVLGDTAAITFILARDGVEIQPDEIPTETLRDLIDLDEPDRLFAVPTGDFQVYVVVPETGTPHVYATSCEVLESADLRHWSGTCLERTVDGQRETVVFEFEPND